MSTPTLTSDHLPGSYSDPAQNAVAVTPSNTTTFSKYTRGLYIGTAGNVNVRMFGDGQTRPDCVFTNVPAGTILPIVCDIVYFTSTTASGIVRLY